MKNFLSVSSIALLSLCSAFASCGKDSPEPEIYYTVNVVCAEGEGSVSVNSSGQTSAKAARGSDVRLMAAPAEKYVFEKWVYEVDGKEYSSTEADFTYKNVTSDITFNAYFGDSEYKVIFEDNFETGSIPDPAKWKLCSKASSAWNTYMSESYDQAYIEDGCLKLVAEKVNGEYRAGGVQMLNDLGFRYGKVEVRARFTKMAQGSWPAIWMMPSRPIWSGWPQCGEIDIMEHLNFDPFVYNVIHSHYVDNLGNRWDPVYSVTPMVDTSEFNTYGIVWDADAITFFVNDEETLTYPNLHLSNNESVKQWPFDTTFYLILNNALGGAGTWPGVISDSQLPAVFEIESVRVSQKR